MPKIGRNDPCVCGSGLKYKKCCLPKEAERQRTLAQAGVDGPAKNRRPIRAAVETVRKAAGEKRQVVWPLGVLLLFSTTEGDAWLLEVTERDALLLAERGEDLEVSIEENPETTEIEWSHSFVLQGERFVVTSYREKVETVYEGYPVKKIAKAMRDIQVKMPPELEGRVHPAEEA